MHGFDMNGWGFMMGFGWIILILVAVVLFYFVNNMQNKNQEPSARDILDKRYANGEIDDEEYQRMKENLKH
ncbi:SHOCT domain-containing protein [Sulfurimonas marina]|uniref:SHOCT domain-containing protein n=1 Tax=Sulfurimonas marina TaxID=2590551 RepID=A0A7M1AXK1_9BACT|nr:SHOCT domain-containing protein [Sulfurimonas marina]QOP41298.1 SHOCT domain-containing protein [Sulfurimonas marina]